MRETEQEPREYREIGRRELVRTFGPAAIAGVVLAGGGALLHGRQGRHRPPRQERAPLPPDWRVDPAAPGRLAIAGGSGPVANLQRALAAMGGIERFVRRGEKVAIKPNCAWDRAPEQAANTNPELVAELVRLCLGAGRGGGGGGRQQLPRPGTGLRPLRDRTRRALGGRHRSPPGNHRHGPARPRRERPRRVAGPEAAGRSRPGDQRADRQAPLPLPGHPRHEELDGRRGRSAQQHAPAHRPDVGRARRGLPADPDRGRRDPGPDRRRSHRRLAGPGPGGRPGRGGDRPGGRRRLGRVAPRPRPGGAAAPRDRATGSASAASTGRRRGWRADAPSAPGTRDLRVLFQALFLLAFAALFFRLSGCRFGGEAASCLLALDPLTAVGTALADWTVPRWAWVGLAAPRPHRPPRPVLLRLDLPARHPPAARRLARRAAQAQGRSSATAGAAGSPLKYLRAGRAPRRAALGANHLGWLDPLPLLHRAVASGVRPLRRGGAVPAGWVASAARGDPPRLRLDAALLLPRALPARRAPRPVRPPGAVAHPRERGRLHRLHPVRDRLPGGGRAARRHRVSECHVCLNCLPACGERRAPLRPGRGRPAARHPVPRRRPAPLPDRGRRRRRGGARRSRGRLGRDARAPRRVRPPGALREEAFLARCVTCGACSASCPTGVIVADVGKTGVEGLFTPVLAHAARLVRALLRPLRRGLPDRRARRARPQGQAGDRRARRRSASAPPSSTSAAACPGPWGGRASSARRCARPPPRRSGWSEVEEPAATAVGDGAAAAGSSRSCAPGAGCARTAARSASRPRSGCRRWGRPATRRNWMLQQRGAPRA